MFGRMSHINANDHHTKWVNSGEIQMNGSESVCRGEKFAVQNEKLSFY